MASLTLNPIECLPTVLPLIFVKGKGIIAFVASQSRGVGCVKLGTGQLEFLGGTEKKQNLNSIKPHVIYVYF